MSVVSAHTVKLTMLKTAIISIRAVVVMVRVMRGHGLLAIMTDDLSSHIQEVEALLLQCCRDMYTQTQKCLKHTGGLKGCDIKGREHN